MKNLLASTFLVGASLVVWTAQAASLNSSERPSEPHSSTLDASVLEQMRLAYKTTQPDSAQVPIIPVEELPDSILLPAFIVREHRQKIPEEAVLTDRSRLQLAEKKYITPLYRATFGPLSQIAGYYFNPLSIFMGWHPNEAEAMTLYRQDQRLRMLEDMDSLTRLERIDDSVSAHEFTSIRLEAYISSR